jgi:hypothetical protein
MLSTRPSEYPGLDHNHQFLKFEMILLFLLPVASTSKLAIKMLRDNGVTLGLQGNPIQENHVYSEGVL